MQIINLIIEWIKNQGYRETQYPQFSKNNYVYNTIPFDPNKFGTGILYIVVRNGSMIENEWYEVEAHNLTIYVETRNQNRTLLKCKVTDPDLFNKLSEFFPMNPTYGNN